MLLLRLWNIAFCVFLLVHALVLPLGRRKGKKSEKILAWFWDGVSVERSFEDSLRSESVVLCCVLEDRLPQFQVNWLFFFIKKNSFYFLHAPNFGFGSRNFRERWILCFCLFHLVLCCLLLFFVCTMCVFSSWLHELDGKVSKPGMEWKFCIKITFFEFPNQLW